MPPVTSAEKSPAHTNASSARRRMRNSREKAPARTGAPPAATASMGVVGDVCERSSRSVRRIMLALEVRRAIIATLAATRTETEPSVRGDEPSLPSSGPPIVGERAARRGDEREAEASRPIDGPCRASDCDERRGG
eukprot:1190559-Prymnesium_polylepis.1